MITTTQFDAITYLEDARKVGMGQEAAEVQVRHIKLAIDEAVKIVFAELNQRELATKKDLEILDQDLNLKLVKVSNEIEKMRKEIEQSKNSFMLWLFSLLSAIGSVIVAFIGHGFHWW